MPVSLFEEACRPSALCVAILFAVLAVMTSALEPGLTTMPEQKTTNAVNIFLKMVGAVRRGITMKPRSANDKEYFAQDWFAKRLEEAGVTFQQQGRNSYPDFLLTAPQPVEGYEVKSLAFTRGKPARRDIDFNSTIPSGRKDEQDVFLVFFLYTGSGNEPRHVQSLSLVHADLINADHHVADEHVNVAIHEFGSYGDGFIRNRKMYVFPHPITIDPDGLGLHRLIVPTDWMVRHAGLRKMKTLARIVAAKAVSSYTIRLHGRGQAEVDKTPYADAGTIRKFDVYEAK
jgi:hypothetical protein